MALSPVSARPADDLASQVARLFFDRQMTKVDIAAHLGISRFRVARLLDGALADGLVRIEFRDIPSEDRELAAAMEERFGLDLCAVATVEADVPRLAAAVLDGLIGPREVIGVAWGATLGRVVREISSRRDPTIEVVQLAGSSARLDPGDEPGAVSRTLAERLGAGHHPIYAPAFVADPAVRAALLAQPEVAQAFARFRALTLAVVGIGAMPSGRRVASSSLLRSRLLDAAEVERLIAAGAVGDLVVHPIDVAGRPVAPELAERAIAIDLDDLRRVRRVVAVAAGSDKAAAIRGALASGIIRILATDAATARRVLDAG
jgi:DNA-binding transcriptional regulator LsrR (DeoR family)